MVGRAELVNRQAVRSASSSVTGMVLLVALEAVFFAAFLGIYAVSFTAAKVWPPAGIETPSVAVPTVGVVVLLVSGAAMAQAMRHAHRPEYQRAALLRWLAAALACAVAFGVLTAIGYAGLPFSVGQGVFPVPVLHDDRAGARPRRRGGGAARRGDGPDVDGRTGPPPQSHPGDGDLLVLRCCPRHRDLRGSLPGRRLMSPQPGGQPGKGGGRG